MEISPALGAANRIDDLAAALRARATQIAAHGAAVSWHSPAALRYLARVDDINAALVACAEAMSGVAELAREHAFRSR